MKPWLFVLLALGARGACADGPTLTVFFPQYDAMGVPLGTSLYGKSNAITACRVLATFPTDPASQPHLEKVFHATDLGGIPATFGAPDCPAPGTETWIVQCVNPQGMSQATTARSCPVTGLPGAPTFQQRP